MPAKVEGIIMPKCPVCDTQSRAEDIYNCRDCGAAICLHCAVKGAHPTGNDVCMNCFQRIKDDLEGLHDKGKGNEDVPRLA